MFIPAPDGPTPVPIPPSTPLEGVVVYGLVVVGVTVVGVVLEDVGVVVDGVVVTGVVVVPAALSYENKARFNNTNSQTRNLEASAYLKEK